MTAKLAQGVARLAFWRKSDAASPEHADSATEASDPMPADDAAPPDVADAPVGRFARLKQFVFRWRRNAGEPSEAADPTATLAPDVLDTAEATADEALPKRSLLARLKSRFRRQAAADVPEAEAEADASTANARQNRETDSSRERDADSDELPVQPGRIRRALAMLSRKWVWIPAMSLVLLGMMSAMLVLLLQSAQEKDRLQTELLAAQQQLDQAASAKNGMPKNELAKTDATDPMGVPTAAGLGTGASLRQTDFDASGCVVSDKESVTQNLRHCIDAFNHSMAGARTVQTAP